MTCIQTTNPVTGHTPGPYHVEAWRDGNGWACYQIEGVCETDEQMEANRRLFEAAPELLSALLAVVELRRRWRSPDQGETIDSIEYVDGLDALNLDALVAKALATYQPTIERNQP